MRRKYAVNILLVFLIGMSFSFAQDCYFDTFKSECQRIESSYNDFSVDVSSDDDLSKVEIEVFNVDNPMNKLLFDQSNFDISQVMPFLEPGIYSVNVKAYDLAGNLRQKGYEYVFDNTEPMPPIVPIELSSSLQSLSVEGMAEPGIRVAVDVRSATGTFVSVSTVAGESGSFTLDLSLNNGLNYVRFYTIRNNGLKSAYVERVVMSGGVEEEPTLNAVSVTIGDLEVLNDRTYGRFTTKRNFYVQGRASGASEGTLIYVNGVKAVVDSNGYFGAFVLLNQGSNEIVARANNVESSVFEIDYVDVNFKFVDVDYDKIISSDSLSIEGKTNFDYPFMLFVNGVYDRLVTPTDSSFSATVSNLNIGKNFIELRGINGESIRDIIYFDSLDPVVVEITNNEFALNPVVGFEIRDDIGVNLNSVVLRVDGQDLESDSMKVKGDYYLFDLSGFDDGIYSYVLSGTDLSGKPFSLSGDFNIDDDNTVIENVVSTAEMIGNNIYTRSGEIKMTMAPSRNIAFKSIYLDDIEQTNYEILSNNNVKLNVNVEEVSGVLRTVFINQDYSEFEQKFVYHSDKEKPVLKLDYVAKPYTTKKVKITGEVIDDNFDWSTLSFNGQKSFTRYGDYFEAIIDVDRANLLVEGSDFAGNYFSEEFGSLLYRDDSVTVVHLGSSSSDFGFMIDGSMPDSDEHKQRFGVLNFVDSYDGFDMNGVYLASDGFEIPVQERFGFRSLNLRGFEGSGLEFSSNAHVNVLSSKNVSYKVDASAPDIYFAGNDVVTRNSKHFVQGMIRSSSPVVSVSGGSNCDFDDMSFVCDVNLEVGENVFAITVQDDSGRRSFEEITIVRVVDDLSVSIDEVSGEYLYSGSGENYLFGDAIVLDAQVSEEAVIKILINGREIVNGVQSGEFEFDLDLSNDVDGVEKSELSFQLKAEDENGNEAYSNVFKVLYQRVFETFARVLVR